MPCSSHITFKNLVPVTADKSLTISNTIWSAIGNWRGFGRFVRYIMRDIRHDSAHLVTALARLNF
jgi:hypothetical protein